MAPDDPGPPLPLPVLERPFSRDVRDLAGQLGLVPPGRVDYRSDRLLARFAVVQRRRFATW